MTHLPECALSDNTDWISWTVECCICDRLRACESRIRSGYADTYTEGIAAGLDAAVCVPARNGCWMLREKR